ncbi:hypothetical protein BDV95DRAFT_170341 [Massariosphaeria phaeospora]|uniref:Secreted protein n=1 Tax=Massariosphaeria phaeospora TaxID=100035 RepID=A0A7C8I2J8_9PLEO|nr:hypothetical protein BDV95DRAFT_170341 [Massariosphaeria phaeospora]
MASVLQMSMMVIATAASCHCEHACPVGRLACNYVNMQPMPALYECTINHSLAAISHGRSGGKPQASQRGRNG